MLTEEEQLAAGQDFLGGLGGVAAMPSMGLGGGMGAFANPAGQQATTAQQNQYQAFNQNENIF